MTILDSIEAIKYLKPMAFLDYKAIFTKGERATDKVNKTDSTYEAQRATDSTAQSFSVDAPINSRRSRWSQDYWESGCDQHVSTTATCRGTDPEKIVTGLRHIAVHDCGDETPVIIHTDSGTWFISFKTENGKTIAFDFDENVAAAWKTGGQTVIIEDMADAALHHALIDQA